MYHFSACFKLQHKSSFGLDLDQNWVEYFTLNKASLNVLYHNTFQGRINRNYIYSNKNITFGFFYVAKTSISHVCEWSDTHFFWLSISQQIPPVLIMLWNYAKHKNYYKGMIGL